MALSTNLELPKFRYTVTATDSNGNTYLAPAVGYKLYVYEAGTSTQLTVYQDAALTTPHSQPITLDADGSAVVYFNAEAKVELQDTDSATVDGFPVDGIQAISAASTATINEWQPSGYTGTYVSGSTFTVTGDQTAAFTVNRMVRIDNGGAYRYGLITASTYVSSTSVTVSLDSGSISSSMDGNEVYLHINSDFVDHDRVESVSNKTISSCTINNDVTGNLTGDVKATNGTTVLDSGTDGTDSTYIGDVTGALTGNADTATAFSSSRTITINGDADGTGASTTGENTITITLDPGPQMQIATATSAGGTSALLDGMSSSYDIYKVHAWNLSRSGSASTLYVIAYNGGDVGSQVPLFTLGTSTTDTSWFEFYIYNSTSTTITKKIHVTGYDSNGVAVLNQVGTFAYTGAITGVRFYTVGSGPFTGDFRMYGNHK